MGRPHHIGVDIEIVRQGGSLLRVSGEVDVSNVHFLRSAIDDVTRGCSPGLVIDLTGTDFIDCSAIATLIAAQHTLASDGCLMVLVTSNPNIKRTLGMVHIESLPGVSLCDDVAAATRILGAQRG